MNVPLPRLIASNSLDLRSFFGIAVRLCTIVDNLHRRQIIHGAITSTAVTIDPQTAEVELLPAEIPGATGGPRLPRAAKFMSPEQTGRMNRSVDYRTDCYSLGVVF